MEVDSVHVKLARAHSHLDGIGLVRGCQTCEDTADGIIAADPTADPRKTMTVEVSLADVQREADPACPACRGKGSSVLGLCDCAGRNFFGRHAEKVVRPEDDEEGRLYWLPGAR